MEQVLKSESIAMIAPALVQARRDVGVAIKNAVNPHLKNKYADLGAVHDAIDNALDKNDLTPFQTPVASDDAKLHLQTLLIHKSGEYIGGTLVMPMSKQDPQGYGSALTYARRYALAAMLNVTQDDDDGARAADWRAKADEAACQPSQCDQMAGLLKQYGRTWEQLTAVYPRNTPYKGMAMDSVTAKDMDTLIKFVKGRLHESKNESAAAA
ncbi:ERF family protein [Chromobacterium haemolyticum]|uniref:ERF family protein n=1 Tax=Chromobacterium haemolyticum TaxID=394935 RepID=UPI0002F5A3AE|nr:ERF family protein [Chromobacterium haemolyticum]